MTVRSAVAADGLVDQLASESSVKVAVFSAPLRMNVTVTESPGRNDLTVATRTRCP